MTVKEQNEIKKEFLRGYKRISNRIKTLENQRDEYRQEIESAKAMQYSDMPKGHKQSDLSDYIVRLEGMEERVSLKIEEKKREKLEIESCITDVDNDIESEILYKRYIELKEWPDIAKEIGYSITQTYRYHGYALKDMIYDCERLKEKMVVNGSE